MIYKGSSYYFQKDVLGDIIAVKNTAGATVATYSYDAYGNCSVASGSNVGNINPFRYRGYYYDTETGFYYLQSRYYDPSIMRFINADDYELISTLASTIGQLNLYAYCNDNPIMNTDPTGEFIIELLATVLAGALVFGVFGGVESYLNNEGFWSGFKIGAISGALMALGGFIGGTIFIGGIMSYCISDILTGLTICYLSGFIVGSCSEYYKENKKNDFDLKSIIMEGVKWGNLNTIGSIGGYAFGIFGDFSTNFIIGLTINAAVGTFQSCVDNNTFFNYTKFIDDQNNITNFYIL